ncbi:hypothetical protein I302_101744 [Kwoniella bestiolae CBS 10118]|uniref:[histone H3]-trimethyl-L-lysine(9) demethylase n=1 Tax=Kwoniella bestiolae CBS 10118 TaxID=1296100 RepID=A0A1B9GD43_9TREE|nr:hypothetical protein I302_00421 [Kwoniella bestiolae CBS 10118]OCF28931.1 hypothetical protein I302_00421 [Kwoniella bestiolae CBS 10118]
MSEDIGDQIVVTIPPQAQSTLPSTSTPQQAEAGPSTRRRTRSSDVSMNGVGVAEPKVEVKEPPRYIQPDHFYPTTNNPNQASIARNLPNIGDGLLSPEDDPQALRGIPVFKPTMEEFQDFEAYATATTAWGQYSGIVKIIPPEEWKESLPPIPKSALADQKIRTPIQQNIFGSSGLFRIANVPKNKNRPLTIKEWFNKCSEKKFTGIGPKDIGKTLNRDSKEAIEWRARKNAELKREKEEKRAKLAQRKARKEAANAPAQAEVQEEEPKSLEEDGDHHDPSTTVPPLDPSSNSAHSSPDPTNPTTPKNETSDLEEQVEPWYKSFNPSEDWLPKDTKPEDYTSETCDALERHLWKNLGLGEPSWYGADMEGSLFVDDKTPWNVAHLPNLLNRWDLKHLPGVNSPYLYFGMWGASFAWHVEDMDLFSINYIHFGAPKYWYAVPQLQSEKFERVLQGYFPEESRHCDQYLRHKAFAVSPHRLANDGVRVNMLTHHQGEFVITYPRGYHAGFNLGFNCAESVNFALDSWVELGRRAKACQCVTHSVHIDVDEMIATEEKRLNGEQELLEAIAEERQNKKPRKRAHTEQNGSSPRKRVKRETEVEIAHGEAEQSMEVEAQEEEEVNSQPKIPVMRKKRPKSIIDLSPTRPKLQPAIVQENPVHPCLFCPSLDKEGLLPALEPTDAAKSNWKPRTGEIRVHHQCALAMPGVGIEDREVDGRLITYVVGLENIESARWSLKCGACEDKRLAKSGAKIQCTKGKCPKAYHVSCAKSHEGVAFNIWEVETPILPPHGEVLEPGQPIPMEKDIKVELLCPTHNPDMKSQIEARKADNLRRKVMGIPVGEKIKIKPKSGESLELILVEVREDTREVVVKDEAGQTGVYPWSSIDFRPTPVKTENEYARVHTHTRRVSEYPSATTTPVTATTLPPPASARPSPQSSPAARPILPLPQVIRASGPSEAHSPNPAIRHAPLRVDQMLNPQNDTPSRAVLCEAPQAASRSNKGHPRPLQTPPQARPPYPTGQYPAVPMTSQQYYSPAPTLYPPQQVLPYDSRDPYNRQLPPVHAGHYLSDPYGQADFRKSSLTDQPPPLPLSHGYHMPPPHGYMLTPPHTAPSRSYAASSQSSNGSSFPPQSNGHTSSQQGSSRNVHQHIPNGSSNGVGKIDLGIQRMQNVMKHLRPLAVPAIHLAGTNGKGSVSAILESCLMAAGMNVGRYNSPHLIEPRDAIRINGRPPPQEAYLDAMRLVEGINHQRNLQATTFEISTAAAYHILNSMQPPLDVMIIECGMGGARDATNIIPDEIKILAGLTSVGLDHTSFLGNTISEIAVEKSQIVPYGGILIVGPQSQYEAIKAASQVTSSKRARLVQAPPSQEIPRQSPPIILKPFRKPFPRLIRTEYPFTESTNRGLETDLQLGGAHQLDNLSLAISILHVLRTDPRSMNIQPKLAGLSDQVIQYGVKRTEWEGRCSWLTYGHLPLLVDGAHNADSSTSLRRYIDSLNFERTVKKRFLVSLSNSPGKSPESVLAPLLEGYEDGEVEVILMEFSTPVEGMPWIKATPLEELYEVAKKLLNGKGEVRIGGKGLEGLKAVLDDLASRYEREEERLTVVCGSLYGVADVYRLMG